MLYSSPKIDEIVRHIGEIADIYFFVRLFQRFRCCALKCQYVSHVVLAIPLEYNNTNNSISFGDLVLDLDENLFESIQFNAALIWAAIDFNAMLFDDQDIVNNDPVNNKDDGMKFQLWLYQQCSMEDIGHHLDANIVGKLIPFFLYILELIFQAIIMPLE